MDEHMKDRWEYIQKVMSEDAIFEGLFLKKESRLKLLSYAKGKKICIWINTPYEECVRRNTRGRNMQMFKRTFQPPTYDEGWDEIIKIKGDAYG